VLEGPPEGETAAAEEVAPEALSRGKHARRPAAGDDLELVAESLLAELAAAEGGAPLGRLAGQVDSAGKKLALMAGGALAVTAVLFLLMVVVGALL
jgi:hypothetical protein